METLEGVLNLDDWSLEEFAWISVGYSSIKHPVNKYRLVDGHEIIFGSSEYRDAKREYDEIISLLDRHSLMFLRVFRVEEDKFNNRKTRWKRNFLINEAAHVFPQYERIDFPWLDWAYKQGYVTPFMVGKISHLQVLSAKVLPEGREGLLGIGLQGAHTYRLPSQVKEAKAKVMSKTEIAAIPENKPPKFTMTDIKPANDFYVWIYAELQTLSRAGAERPTADEMRKIITEKKPPQFKKLNSRKVVVHLDDDGNDETMKLNALAQRINFWTNLVPK
jgi:hypothetical protein